MAGILLAGTIISIVAGSIVIGGIALVAGWFMARALHVQGYF
jgi:hypothetical protein